MHEKKVQDLSLSCASATFEGLCDVGNLKIIKPFQLVHITCFIQKNILPLSVFIKIMGCINKIRKVDYCQMRGTFQLRGTLQKVLNVKKCKIIIFFET